MNSPTRLFELLPYQLEKFNLPICLADKRDGNWIEKSTEEVIELCKKLTFGLLNLGISPGDKIAIISENRSEWNIVDIAIQQSGAIGVPMYPTITIEDYAYIFDHSEVKVVFASNQEICDKAKAAIEMNGSDISIYSFEKLDNFDFWENLFSNGSDESEIEMKKRMDAIHEDDLLTIIYTSGTTGRPKGVMLSHKNVMSNAMAASERPAYLSGDRALSFLPLCHIFERVAIYFYWYLGVSVYYAESLDLLVDNIREIKPHGFNCVPRLLEKVYDKIIEKGYALSGVKKQLFFWAVNLGLKYEPNRNHGAIYNLKLSIARKLIFSKWQEALGGNIKHIIIGASALQIRLKRVFWAADIKIMEGYGLTETSPGVCIGTHQSEQAKLEYVGPLLRDVKVKIAEDGEILVKGPNIMQGYYKDPEQTDEVIKDAWFHSGDIGELDEEGYLRITDRKKEMFKTSGGKYVAPQVIENRLKESILIEQAMVIGENRKFPAALVVPNMEGVESWCKRHDIDMSSGNVLENEKLIDKFQNEISEANQQFGNWEQIKKFHLVSDQWGIDSGELTPTMKLKRRIIKEKYSEEVEKIYDV